MNYIELEFIFENPNTLYFEVLQVELGDIGFESFSDTNKGFLAYCPKKDFCQGNLSLVLEKFKTDNPNINYSLEKKEIEEKNWNAEWESSFSPVRIGDFCYIHADFHTPILKDVKYNIEIIPKMSFGTAHHPTTYQMIELLSKEELKNKSVVDMGCGTGVLAILSKMMGASYVEAIDNDQWAFENSKENVLKNGVDIKIRLGDACLLDKSYDILIANINRNILLRDIKTYAEHINEKGVLLLSGFYTEDIDIISQEANKYNLYLNSQLSKENWAALRYIKK